MPSHRLLALVSLAVAARALAQTPEEPPPIDHAGLRQALAAKPQGDAAAKLAEKLRKWFGADNLKNGTAKSEGQEIAWALEAPGAKEVSAQPVDGLPRQKLEPVGETGVWAAVTTLSDGTGARYFYSVDGRRIGLFNVEAYTPHPDSLPQPGVPRGKVIQQKKLQSKVFPGTTRDWWIYVPAQYKPGKPAAVMVFQDGGTQYLKPVPIVFDNLIHKGDMPVTVGVFINPGVFADGKRNRSVEYDTLSPAYSRFVIDEILPEVEKTVKLRKDPESHAIAGLSSGAICAFTVAWERPDQFRKVLSWIGTYTNIAAGPTLREGGHNYQALIRRTPRKPIRVFLQDGEQDLQEEAGGWWLANQTMEGSLRWAGWDFRAQWGHGFHSPRHGLAILPDSLRWLWRDWKSWK